MPPPLPRLEDIRRERARRHLADFIPWATPGHLSPHHLAPLLEELEAVQRGETREVVVHSPPRHAKTSTLLHAAVWMLQAHPDWTIGYLSYGAEVARSKSREALDIARRVGLPLATEGVTEWRTPQGGGMVVRGVGEGLTGLGVDVALVDDVLKDRTAAESAIIRTRIRDWFSEVVYTRRNPGKDRPRSIVVNMARWHPDDLAGYLTREKGWRYLCLPALAPDGAALWPTMWSRAALEGIREQLGEYSFASLYQGQPRPRGGAVFGDPFVYEALPGKYRVAIGLDLAYTARTASDWSVLVVLAEARGYFYLLDVVRMQLRAPEFATIAREYRRRYPSAQWRWYAAGTELGVADFLRAMLAQPEPGGARSSVPLQVLPPKGDKFVRAQPYAAAWNARKVLLPEGGAPWVAPFVEEHLNFTGVNDAHDDTIDAAAAAFDVLVAGGRFLEEGESFRIEVAGSWFDRPDHSGDRPHRGRRM